MSQAVIDEDKDRSIRLFTYLKELVRLRSKIIRDISAYDETLWLHQIPHEKGWYSGHWEGEEERTDETWVEIKKPKIPVCPTPPLICEGWYSKGDLFNTFEYSDDRFYSLLAGKFKRKREWYIKK